MNLPTPLHSGSERMEHLEEDDTEAVDVALVIDDAVEELVFVSIECLSLARKNFVIIFEIQSLTSISNIIQLSCLPARELRRPACQPRRCGNCSFSLRALSSH